MKHRIGKRRPACEIIPFAPRPQVEKFFKEASPDDIKVVSALNRHEGLDMVDLSAEATLPFDKIRIAISRLDGWGITERADDPNLFQVREDARGELVKQGAEILTAY